MASSNLIVRSSQVSQVCLKHQRSLFNRMRRTYFQDKALEGHFLTYWILSGPHTKRQFWNTGSSSNQWLRALLVGNGWTYVSVVYQVNKWLLFVRLGVGGKVLLLSMKVFAGLAWRSRLSFFYWVVLDVSFCLVFCLIFHIFGRDAYLLFATCYFYVGILLSSPW